MLNSTRIILRNVSVGQAEAFVATLTSSLESLETVDDLREHIKQISVEIKRAVKGAFSDES